VKTMMRVLASLAAAAVIPACLLESAAGPAPADPFRTGAILLADEGLHGTRELVALDLTSLKTRTLSGRMPAGAPADPFVVSPDGSLAVFATRKPDGTFAVSVVPSQGGAPPQELSAGGDVRDLKISPDGRKLLIVRRTTPPTLAPPPAGGPAVEKVTAEFRWLDHLDRPLISPMELLHVSETFSIRSRWLRDGSGVVYPGASEQTGSPELRALLPSRRGTVNLSGPFPPGTELVRFALGERMLAYSSRDSSRRLDTLFAGDLSELSAPVASFTQTRVSEGSVGCGLERFAWGPADRLLFSSDEGTPGTCRLWFRSADGVRVEVPVPPRPGATFPLFGWSPGVGRTPGRNVHFVSASGDVPDLGVELQVGGWDWPAEANPEIYRRIGVLSFYVDETGLLRGNDDGYRFGLTEILSKNPGQATVQSVRLGGPQGTTATALLQLPAVDAGSIRSAWSPDGKALAILDRNCSPGHLYVADPAGPEVIRVDRGVAFDAPGQPLHWTSDGSRLVYRTPHPVPNMGFSIVVVGGSGLAPLSAFVANSHSTPFDLAVFGFAPVEIAAAP